MSNPYDEIRLKPVGSLPVKSKLSTNDKLLSYDAENGLLQVTSYSDILGNVFKGWTEIKKDYIYNGNWIRQITGYVGGTGTLPTALQERVGKWYGSNGLVSSEAAAAPILTDEITPAKTVEPTNGNIYAFGAGRASNTGTDNIAMGKGAHSYAANASLNIAIGKGAMRYSENNTGNIAIGENALSYNLNVGNYNVAIGNDALDKNKGNRNLGIGQYAMLNTEGDDNVGIGFGVGPTATGTKLTLIGTGANAATGVSYSTAIGSNAVADKSGQTVIGNESNQELKLFGTVKLNNHTLYWSDYAKQNFFLAGAGRADMTNGTANFYGNVAIGYKAMEQTNDGLMNTAVGFQALQKCTTGVDHTAVGAGALQSQISGVGCTAMGRLAMANATTGTNNTGLGDTALEFNVTGSQNTAVGYSCGIKAGGSGNALFGNFAGGHFEGRNGPLCSWNETAVFGSEAMMSNVTGQRNTLFGFRAGHVLTQGDNAGLGHEVLRVLTTGTQNTALGNGAASKLEQGSNNVFIGFKAGGIDGQKVNATGTTVIGSQAKSTRDNEIVIGKNTDTHVTIAGVEFTKAQIQALKNLVAGS